MPAITDYSSLSSSIANWDERSHDADELIGLAEAEFRIYFGPNYIRESSSTITFVDGVGGLPAGFIRPVSLTHATNGPIPIVSKAALDAYNPLAIAGNPDMAAISGANIYTAPVYDGTMDLVFESAFTGLSASNPTNWLITTAPQAYLSMCMSLAKAKYEEYDAARLYRGTALETLAGLNIQSAVARGGGFYIRGATP